MFQSLRTINQEYPNMPVLKHPGPPPHAMGGLLWHHWWWKISPILEAICRPAHGLPSSQTWGLHCVMCCFCLWKMCYSCVWRMCCFLSMDPMDRIDFPSTIYHTKHDAKWLSSCPAQYAAWSPSCWPSKSYLPVSSNVAFNIWKNQGHLSMLEHV